MATTSKTGGTSWIELVFKYVEEHKYYTDMTTEGFENFDDGARIKEGPVTPEDVLETNLSLYNSGYAYRIGRNVEPETPGDLVLKNVYTPDDVRNISAEIIENFPKEEPLTVQSALWVRAFAGLHFFYDANHRTGIATLRAMMDESGVVECFEPFKNFEPRTIAALDASKEDRRWITRDKIYERDALYEVWRSYFEDVLVQ